MMELSPSFYGAFRQLGTKLSLLKYISSNPHSPTQIRIIFKKLRIFIAAISPLRIPQKVYGESVKDENY